MIVEHMLGVCKLWMSLRLEKNLSIIRVNWLTFSVHNAQVLRDGRWGTPAPNCLFSFKLDIKLTKMRERDFDAFGNV